MSLVLSVIRKVIMSKVVISKVIISILVVLTKFSTLSFAVYISGPNFKNIFTPVAYSCSKLSCNREYKQD